MKRIGPCHWVWGAKQGHGVRAQTNSRGSLSSFWFDVAVTPRSVPCPAATSPWAGTAAAKREVGSYESGPLLTLTHGTSRITTDPAPTTLPSPIATQAR